MTDKLETVQFESSTACNANCVFCPRNEMTRKHGTMSEDLFLKIVKEAKEMGVRELTPFLNGEPFLFSKLFDWIDVMEKEGFEVHFFTNGSILTKDKVNRLLKYKNIKFVFVSFHGASEETYERVMRGLKFSQTKKNVEYLISKEKEASFLIRVLIVRYEDTIDEIKQFVEMWGKDKEGKDRAIVATFLNWAGARHSKFEVKEKPYPCYRVLNHMTVLWDGRVCLCCMDYNGKVILGDLNKQSMKEIWEGNQWMRDKHRNLDFDLELCRSCNFNRYYHDPTKSSSNK